MEEFLETPWAARTLDRSAESVQMNRQKRRVALVREFGVLSQRYTEHVLDKLSAIAVDDPGFLVIRQQRGELADPKHLKTLARPRPLKTGAMARSSMTTTGAPSSDRALAGDSQILLATSCRTSARDRGGKGDANAVIASLDCPLRWQ